MKIAIWVVLFCGASSGIAAQQPGLTLDDCRNMALENNVRMKNARLNIEQARQVQREAFTKYFPVVRAQGLWMSANKGLLELDLMPTVLPALSLLDNGLMGTVSAVQPLASGGQIVNSNRLARVGFRVSGVQAEQTRDEVVLTTEQYYWQYVGLLEKLRTVEIMQRFLERTEKDVSLYVEAGVTDRNDLMKVRLQVNDLKSARMEVENGLSIVKMLLGQYIGLGLEDFAVAYDTLPPLPVPENYKTDHRAALVNTSSYKLLDMNVEAARLQKRLAVGKNLPTVGVGAAYSYDNLLDTDHRVGMVFASVSIPVSDWWGGSHAVKKQKYVLEQAESERDDAIELLLIRMQKCWNDLLEAFAQVNLARETIVTAEENLRLNADYYRAGTVTLTDLLDAQGSLQQARDRYTDSYTDYRIKLTVYLQATGR